MASTHQSGDDGPGIQDSTVLLQNKDGRLGHAVVISPHGHTADGYVRDFALLELLDQDILIVYYNGAGVVGCRSHFLEMLFALRCYENSLASGIMDLFLNLFQRANVVKAKRAPVSSVDLSKIEHVSFSAVVASSLALLTEAK